MFISKSHCTLLIFRMPSLNLINGFSARDQKDAYKFFRIFTGMKCYLLFLRSHNFSILREFFWRTLIFSSVHIFLLIFKSGLWTVKSFNMVTPSSAILCLIVLDLWWHEAGSGWKISPSLKSGIKLSFSNWMSWHHSSNLQFFTNFLEPSLFYVSLKHQTLTLKFHCFDRVMWIFLLSLTLLDKFSLIRMQLYSSFIVKYDIQSASQSSYFFDQINLAFQCFLVNVGFLAEMQPLSLYSHRMQLVVSTDTKLDMSYYSITFLEIFNSAFALLVTFCIIRCSSIRRWPYLDRCEKLPVAWNFERISKIPLLNIPNSFITTHWLVFQPSLLSSFSFVLKIPLWF